MGDRYDIAVIGGGPGGYVAALRASQLGARVALAEETFIGGVCLNVGCIPTKALLRSAEVYDTVREAKQFGVAVEGTIGVDWSAMQKRKNQIVKRLTTGVGSLLKRSQVSVLNGRGRLVDAHVVEVTGEQGVHRVEADSIILATGSRPIQLPLPGFDLPGVLDSSGALALDELPARMLIVGGGYMAYGSRLKEFIDLAHTYGVPAYPSTNHFKRPIDAVGQASNFWALGADGVYLFNVTVHGFEHSVIVIRPRPRTIEDEEEDEDEDEWSLISLLF